jgi:hypothetical protein
VQVCSFVVLAMAQQMQMLSLSLMLLRVAQQTIKLLSTTIGKNGDNNDKKHKLPTRENTIQVESCALVCRWMLYIS